MSGGGLARWLLPVTTLLLAAAVGLAVYSVLRRGRAAPPRVPDAVPAGRPSGGSVPEAPSVSEDAVALARRFNETTALNVLESLALRQLEARLRAFVDSDGDGVGEALGFVELAGVADGRLPTPLRPAPMGADYAALDERGQLSRAGYRFRVILPAARGGRVAERRAGFAQGDVDAEAAERSWWAQAWPERLGETGVPTFVVSADGRVLATDGLWSGPGAAPPLDAGPAAPPAEGATSADAEGRPWRLAR